MLNLTGASQAANTITTATGVTTNINVPLGGTNGITKSGSGTLLLGAVSVLSPKAYSTRGY